MEEGELAPPSPLPPHTPHTPHTLTPLTPSQDLLGLQQLDKAGRLHFLSAPFNHLQFTDDWFNKNLMPYIKVDQVNAKLPISPP